MSAEYRRDLIRDAFINGLSWRSIRLRLLKNNQLTVAQAYDKACSLRIAQELFDACLNCPLPKCCDDHAARKRQSLTCKWTQKWWHAFGGYLSKLRSWAIFVVYLTISVVSVLPETLAVIRAERKDISPRYVFLNHPLSDWVNHNEVKQPVNHHHLLYIRLQLSVPQVYLRHLCKFLSKELL